jgi:hypothetical protein
MKVMGMALAIGFVLGPLGVMGISYVLIGIVLAAGVAAVGGGIASAIGFAPTLEEAQRAKNWD